MTGEKLVEPFIEQCDVINKYLREKDKVVIGTLGPDSTSSVFSLHRNMVWYVKMDIV